MYTESLSSLRVEIPGIVEFSTSKTVNSALWFVNNQVLETRICSYLAKYAEKYGVKLYAFVIQGNHYHLLAEFVEGTRAAFFKDFNARIAEAVRELVPAFGEGSLFRGKYKPQFLPLEEDVEDKFFYSALQPVSSGLCEKVSDYPGYNSFSDAVRGKTRKFKLVNRGEYNSRKRFDKSISIEDYTKTYELKFERLSNYKKLSQKEYSKLMHKKLEKLRLDILSRKSKEGYKYPSPEYLKKIKPGSIPKTTEESEVAYQ